MSTSFFARARVRDFSNEIMMPPSLSSSSSSSSSSRKRAEITYSAYEDESQLPEIMKIMEKELSEPYSIYTYRYFIHGWKSLCIRATAKKNGSDNETELVGTELTAVIAWERSDIRFRKAPGWGGVES